MSDRRATSQEIAKDILLGSLDSILAKSPVSDGLSKEDVLEFTIKAYQEIHAVVATSMREDLPNYNKNS